MEPGGRADKPCNEFERSWGVLQFLRVLAGEAASVYPEGLGPDERGVDLWVTESNDSRVGHQCKRNNGSDGKWTIADLASEGILESARYQIARAANHRFAFVSADAIPILEDLLLRNQIV